MRTLLKNLIPNRALPLPVLRGPFRGATIEVNPRHSLRKLFGLYEHELNGWLKHALPRVTTVLDVGANDGYFTLGCAAAFRRLGKSGEIIAFEPGVEVFENLKLNALKQEDDQIRFFLHNCFVGAEINSETTTLDEIARQRKDQRKPENALIKIDVEGAELDVIAAATAWLNPTNYFLIEVHWDASFLTTLRKIFLERGMKLTQINQQPLPLIGYEARGREQWWLVSDLS